MASPAGGVALLANASATGSWTRWGGGRTALVTFGTLPTTYKLQILGKDGSTAVDVATITAAGVTSYDLPPGEYRMSVDSGSPSGLYADLVSVPYY